jgi:lipopolysaccharide/colanic/teichoic acid biosynthesis glycosyltransferase
LRGEMSLVGPRPLLVEYLPLYDEQQRRRHEVKPGITGWAQINGRNAIEWSEKFALDQWYVENWSNELDVKILVATVMAVIRREGVSPASGPTMPRFTGNQTSSAGARGSNGAAHPSTHD